MNRHPVDRMADLRDQIVALETEFAALRDQVIAGEVALAGAEWRARILTRARRSIVLAEAQRALPPELFSAIVRTEEQTVVMLSRLADAKPKRTPRRRTRRQTPRAA